MNDFQKGLVLNTAKNFLSFSDTYFRVVSDDSRKSRTTSHRNSRNLCRQSCGALPTSCCNPAAGLACRHGSNHPAVACGHGFPSFLKDGSLPRTFATETSLDI
jgi:hypothetical protein